jgi:hypothetical protein
VVERSGAQPASNTRNEAAVSAATFFIFTFLESCFAQVQTYAFDAKKQVALAYTQQTVAHHQYF